MTRERVRRSCGHLEAVYAVGFGVRRIHERERELCGVCRQRRSLSDRQEEEKREKENDRKSSLSPDSSGKSGTCLSEREQSSDKGDSR